MTVGDRPAPADDSVGRRDAATPGGEARGRWAPYAVVLTIGLLFAAGVAIGADRQPYIWIIPPLVLTGLILALVALSDRRGEESAARALSAELGLRDSGVHPVPPLTSVLARAEPAHLLAGQLDDGAPVRVAHVRAGRSRLAVAATEILDPDRLVADPHAILGAESTAAAEVVRWADTHALPLGLAAEGGTLVLATPVARGEDPPLRALLAAAVEARALLA